MKEAKLIVLIKPEGTYIIQGEPNQIGSAKTFLIPTAIYVDIEGLEVDINELIEASKFKE